MEKMEFDYFRGMEGEQYSFYRVPKVLFTDEYFRKLSCEAKVLYGLMLDRMSLSMKNKWIDEENRVYIIFTVDEIAELLDCGAQKAVKLMKELDSNQGIGLIEKKRLGLGKPNVIYVKNFVLKEKCSFEQEEQETGNAEDVQNSENHNSRIVKTENQEFPESQFKNDENHNSGIHKIKNQELLESKSQNDENQNPRMMKITNQEFPESQFKNDENHNSRMVKIIIPEFPKSHSNNTDINNTEYSDTESHPSYLSFPYSASMSQVGDSDAIDEMDTYRRQIQENIAYDDFLQQKIVTQKKLDELVELMVEVMILPKGQAIRIAGADRPVEVVKSRFMQIGHSHIEYVIRCLDNNTTKVGNIKAYLLTALYNSVMTMDHYYQAEVQHGMYG